MRLISSTVALVSLVAFSASPAFAETVELVTYYPAPGAGNVSTDRLHASRGTIGEPYSLAVPDDADLPDGTFLVADRLGVGLGLNLPPPGPFSVFGRDDAVENVTFMPGANTGAAGTPEIRVGIGIADPTSRLQVASEPAAAGADDGIGITGTRPRILATDNATTFTSGLGTASAADNFGVGTVAGDASLFSQGGNLRFATGATGANPTVRMTLLQTGNFGVGTLNPLAPLSVARDQNAGAAVPSQLGIFGTTTSNKQLLLGFDTTANYGSIQAIEQGVSVRPLVLQKSGGNVGIGVITPGAALDVGVGAAARGGYTDLLVGPGSNDVPQIELYDVNKSGAIRYMEGQGLAFFTNGSPFLHAVTIDPVGRMGIGTSGPGYRLDVAGQAHATGFPTSSDLRLKANVASLTGVLEKLDRIRPVVFDWNDTYNKLGRSSGHREIGVIAQDVEAVFPELVTTWGEEQYRAVDYGRFTAVLLEAVKELDAKVKRLEEKNRRLQKFIGTLEAKN